jgi:hypothetical protein
LIGIGFLKGMLRQARLDVPGIFERKGTGYSLEGCSGERKF